MSGGVRSKGEEVTTVCPRCLCGDTQGGAQAGRPAGEQLRRVETEGALPPGVLPGPGATSWAAGTCSFCPVLRAGSSNSKHCSKQSQAGQTSVLSRMENNCPTRFQPKQNVTSAK